MCEASSDEEAKDGKECSATRGACIDYTPKDRAKIGRYVAENGPARVTRCFVVPETTVRRLKAEYLQKLKPFCNVIGLELAICQI